VSLAPLGSERYLFTALLETCGALLVQLSGAMRARNTLTVVR
jgi:hypothetical protein